MTGGVGPSFPRRQGGVSTRILPSLRSERGRVSVMKVRQLVLLVGAGTLLLTLGPELAAQRLSPVGSRRGAISHHEPPPLPRFHLTARPWKAGRGDRSELLDMLDALCRAMAEHQDERGAIVDPMLHREFQYATPYFAYAVGVLLQHGRAMALRESGLRAMDHATESFAGGHGEIPDGHGEFFIASLAGALELYEPYAERERRARWERRLERPIDAVIKSRFDRTNNWRTYAMRGEWSRAREGLVDPDSARSFVESGWRERSQRARILLDRWNLYQDWSSDPQSHAVEAVGRTNLLALVAEGYDGPSAGEIERAVRRGTEASLLFQSPDGQAPPNGRADNHVWNDLVYALAFELAAREAWERGDSTGAGRYRRASSLGVRSIRRWRSPDGFFHVTKNRFPVERRVGYQPASQWSNYNGTIAYHLAELIRLRRTTIPEQPAPSEIGGYAISADPGFGTFVANAGGMQVIVNTRGATTRKYGKYWTPLGTVRFARSGWDGRLGPGDGIHRADAGARRLLGLLGRLVGKPRYDYRIGSSVTFGPAWTEAGGWLRIGDMSDAYRAETEVEFVHPLLVRFELTYHDVTGRGGPILSQQFTVTPDGVLVRTIGPPDRPFGTIVPMLVDDGRPLVTEIDRRIARTRYPGGDAEQVFLAASGSGEWKVDGPPLMSSYGRLRPVRAVAAADTQSLFVYPRSENDPSARDVAESLSTDGEGFRSVLARVTDSLYVGRWSAGGYGRSLNLDADRVPELTFDRPCRFVVRLVNGRPVEVESDRGVRVRHRGRDYRLDAYDPVDLLR